MLLLQPLLVVWKNLLQSKWWRRIWREKQKGVRMRNKNEKYHYEGNKGIQAELGLERAKQEPG